MTYSKTDRLHVNSLIWILFSFAIAVSSCTGHQEVADNTLSLEEQEKGWQLLFNGQNLQGFYTMPGGSWKVKDGMIVGTSKESDERHGLLVTDEQYDDFIVQVNYKALEGNSGLYFRVEKVEGNVGVHGFQAEIDADGNDVGGLYETGGGHGWFSQPGKRFRNIMNRMYGTI